MKLVNLKENPIVFFDSTIKSFLSDEERSLGRISYTDSYGSGNFPIKANIIYLNDEGVAMLANDYFFNKGLKTFGNNDGVSAGYMIDNWSSNDVVTYSEKPAPANIESLLNDISLETAGYSREEFEEDINSLAEKIWSLEDYKEVALEIGFKLAKYYITARSGESMDRKDYDHSYEDSIPLNNEDEALRSLFPTVNGNLVTRIQIVDSEEKGPRIELDTENENELTMAVLTKEAIVEMIDLLTEQAFYGPTTIGD